MLIIVSLKRAAFNSFFRVLTVIQLRAKYRGATKNFCPSMDIKAHVPIIQFFLSLGGPLKHSICFCSPKLEEVKTFVNKQTK